MHLRFGNAVRVSKDIAIDVINEAIRLYFGGALLFALFFRSCLFLEKLIFKEKTVFPVLMTRLL